MRESEKKKISTPMFFLLTHPNVNSNLFHFGHNFTKVHKGNVTRNMPREQFLL